MTNTTRRAMSRQLALRDTTSIIRWRHNVLVCVVAVAVPNGVGDISASLPTCVSVFSHDLDLS